MTGLSRSSIVIRLSLFSILIAAIALPLSWCLWPTPSLITKASISQLQKRSAAEERAIQMRTGFITIVMGATVIISMIVAIFSIKQLERK
jgi:hypothetical protein